MDDVLRIVIAKAIAEKLGDGEPEEKYGPPIPLPDQAKVAYRDYMIAQKALVQELRTITQRGEVLTKRLDANRAEFFEQIEKLMPEVSAGGHGCKINAKDGTVQVALCDNCDQHPMREPPDWVKAMLADDQKP